MCDCMQGLTHDDIERLKAPLPLDGHEVRVADDDADSAQWLCYAEEEPVIDRLSEIDPNWSFEITRIEKSAKHVTIYGIVTVKGVSRACVGGGSAKRDGLTDDDEKGAATDAIKRGARLFGVGIYLKQAPRIRTKWAKVTKEMSYDDKRKAWNTQEAAKQEAWTKFEAWYKKEFGTPAPAPKPAGQSPEQQQQIRDERDITRQGKPPAPPATKQPSELDAHFGPRGSAHDAAPELDTPVRSENPVGEVIQGGEYDPARDMTPFTSTTSDKIRMYMKNAGLCKNISHATNAILVALTEAGKITPDEQGVGDQTPKWGAIYGKKLTIADVWAAVEQHYAKKAA